MRSAYLFVAGTVLLTVFGQIVIKWQAGKAGELPGGAGDRVRYFTEFLTNPWVLLSFASAFVAALFWIAALSKLDLSRAYPFVAASFVLVLFLSAVFFSEPVTATKVVGALLIVTGLVVGSQGL